MNIKYWVGILFICLCFTSCRTKKNIPVRREIPVITENKLLKNIDTAKLNYNTLYAKRIDATFTNKKKSDNFKVSLKLKRDTFIQVSVTYLLGMEVARILLTPDSVKFVDVYHKEYFISDYDFFNEKYDVSVNFDFMQNILTNTYFNLGDCLGIEGKGKYKLDRVQEGYELSSVEERSLNRKLKKLYKKKRKNKEFTLILQKKLIDPQLFRPLSMSIEDVDEETGLCVDYRNFKEYSGKSFPEKMFFNVFSGKDKTVLELKFIRLEFDSDIDSNFRISSKYKRVN